MTRAEAIKKFGSVINLAKALGITRQAIYAWPEELPLRLVDEIRGAVERIKEEKLLRQK
ncbi:MAG: Cro/CI family transcriptional regulator [Thermoplasmataceae archaeon]